MRKAMPNLETHIPWHAFVLAETAAAAFDDIATLEYDAVAAEALP
jgi:hypothetical protein